MRITGVSRAVIFVTIAISLLLGFMTGLIFSLLPRGNDVIIRRYHDELEKFAIAEVANDDPSETLTYHEMPTAFHSKGLKYYWVRNGYVFFVLPQNGVGIDNPEEVIFFDTQSRPKAPKKVLDMYPNFTLYGISYSTRPSWYYWQFRT